MGAIRRFRRALAHRGGVGLRVSVSECGMGALAEDVLEPCTKESV
jgi:hypothetical protein